MASMVANVAGLQLGTVLNVVTLTGTGVVWVPGTPGVPAFTLSGGVGALIVAQTVTDSTHANVTIVSGLAAATLTLGDPVSGASMDLPVFSRARTALGVPPEGLGY